MVNLKKIINRIMGRKQQTKEIWPNISKEELRRISYISKLFSLAALCNLPLTDNGYDVTNPKFYEIKALVKEETGFDSDSYSFRDIYSFLHLS